MTDMQGVNIPMPTTDAQHLLTEIGLNKIDLGFVMLIMQKVLPPEQAAQVNKVLQNVSDSMNALQGLAHLTQAGLVEAVAQRNTALAELDQLTAQVQQIDEENPLIADLVRTVWDAAQADMLRHSESQKGA